MKNFEIMKFLIFTCILIVFFGACKVQTPRCVGLYVDADEPIKETMNITDSLFVIGNADTLQTLDTTKLALNSIEEEQFENNEITSDTNIFKNRTSDSISIIKLKELVRIKNDSIAFLNKKIKNYSIQQSTIHDTVFLEKEVVKEVQVNNDVSSNENLAHIIAQNDSIKQLQNQLIALLKQQSTIHDTVFIEKKVVKMVPVNNDVANNENSARMAAQSDSIKQLQNQLIALLKQQSTIHDTVFIEKKVVKMVPVNNDVANNENSARMAAQSDSIKQLQNQIIALQNQKATVHDTVFIETDVVKTVAVSNDLKSNDNLARIAAQNDSIKQLKNEVIALRNQKATAHDTVFIEKEVVKTVQVTEAPSIDTINIIAYYEIGSVIPIAADSIINKIKNLIQTKNVLKISISGYTDISGNRIINKAITRKRILYFSEKLAAFFPIERIFHQNFGDTFASNTILESDRRIVLTLIFKK